MSAQLLSIWKFFKQTWKLKTALFSQGKIIPQVKQNQETQYQANSSFYHQQDVSDEHMPAAGS